ncbi:DNA adenine methylase [Nostoc punctiforme]|uniref:Site-specific DNA-methyltransferase (adenine-specific) n=1 Tax=Nostoc punctiforme (strain ATCC 29133 / PCC 73102) TaxID=63737 RepID=Q93LL5_NOSP7|nr:DNA adenine methylase [Nostoc punctiforme]AAK68651.1 adenine-specific DNA methyltransferase [Nostoc punctiforme PCC 73102]ACC79453.1 DNA adenine methylase [Nostoc punctiforme PCC 73102]
MVIQIPKETSPRPFLKWAGGKSRLIQQYIPYFPKSYKNYYEPFLGGGAVFFYLQPKAATLTDINAELINTYCCVRDRVEELISLLKEHKIRHNKDYYYSVRNNSGGTDLEKAARLIYLNKTCFNGLYRVNSQGKFNVPLGRYENPNICSEVLLQAASEALYYAEIKQADFTEVLNHATSSDDFVFFDPPYHPISETSYFTAYSQNCFSKKDQEVLRDTCAELASRGVKVMVCNSDSEFIRNIYTDINFEAYKIKAARSINSNIKNRGMIDELLITSFKDFYLPRQ